MIGSERRFSRFRRGASRGGDLPSPSAGLPTSRPSFTETNNYSDGSDSDIENQMEDNASATADNKRKPTSSPPGSAESELGCLLWSAGRMFRDAKRSVSKPARELRDLLFSDKLEKKIKEIKQKHNKGKVENENELVHALERIILLYVPILKTCTNDKDLYHYYYKFRKSVQAALEKVGAAGLINMGEDLSEETLLLLTLHYATDSEKNNVTGTDKLSKMMRGKSSCIDFAWLMLSGSLFREYFRSRLEEGEILPPPLHPEEDFEGEAPISDSTPSEPAALEDTPEDGEDTSDTQAAAGGNGEASPNTSQLEEKARAYWNKVIEYITKRITLLDFRFVISKDKDTFQRELKELVGGDMDLLDIIGAMNVGFHNLYYHLRTGGGRLPNIIMSTHIWNIVYSLCDSAYQAEAAQLCGYLPHPECFLAGYIRDVLVYDDDLVKYFDKIIEAGFAEIFFQVFGVDELSSTVARRFNRGLLTDEEVAALKELLLKIRIKGGTTCGKMRQLIKAIMDHLLSKGTGIDTEEEAFDLLPGILRGLRARYASDPTVGVDAMMEDEGKVEEAEKEEDATNDDDTDYSVYVDACYDTYKKLIKQCDKKSRQNIDKLVAKLISLYKGSAKSGLMQTLTSKIFGTGGLDSDCKTEQITAKLEELKSRMEVEGGASDDILVAFTKLLKYAPDYASELGIKTLAAKLQNMFMGSKTTGLMQTLASAMLVQFGVDGLGDMILDKLESLHQQYKSSLNNDGSDSGSDSHHSSSEFDVTVYEAYLALVTHKPNISENFSSLTSLISYYSLNDEATFQQNLDKLEEYIEDNFDKPNGRFADSDVKFVYSRTADGKYDSLYQWWSAVIGYATHRGLAPMYKKASAEQVTRLSEILGDNFDEYSAIDAAIEAAKTQKHEKKDTAATKKKKSKSRLRGLFSSNNAE